VFTIYHIALPLHLLFCPKQGRYHTTKAELLICMLIQLKTRPSKNGQKGSLFLPRMWTSSRGSRSDLGPHSLWWCMPI
jgi:hypothetical protein